MDRPLGIHGAGFYPKPIIPQHMELDKVAYLLLDNGDWDVPKLHLLFEQETISNVLKGGKPCGNVHYFSSLVEQTFGNLKCWSAIKFFGGEFFLMLSLSMLSLPKECILKMSLALFVGRGIMLVVDSGARLWDWVKFLWSLKSRGVEVDKLFLYASIVVDTIWKARNDKVHNNFLSNINHCVDSITFGYTDYGSGLFSLPDDAIPHGWTPPLEEWIKINCDVKVGCCSMCGVALARDHTGSILWVATNMLNFTDPLIGEASAYQLAMEKADYDLF
uniref:Uncharacterized protein n=1 Tax=Cannabis sativa TaxID=3483 RepID=A0A803Q0U8_CANSA